MKPIAALSLLVALAFPSCHLAIDGELGAVRCEDEGAFGPPSCPEGQSCQAGLCAARGGPLGHPCQADDECAAPAFCFDPGAFGEPGGRFCTAPCCSSPDCGPVRVGQVCHAPASGAGRLCWSAEALGRPAPGEGVAGAACSDATGCRSAWCVGGECADVCCDDRFCRSSVRRCVVTPPTSDSEQTWACGPIGGDGGDSSPCQSDAECETGACISVGATVQLCAQPCCSSVACGELTVDGQAMRLACALTSGGVQACSALVARDALGAVGSACASDEECRSGRCRRNLGALGYCSDACCRDQDCGDTSRFACQPESDLSGWSLQCVRK